MWYIQLYTYLSWVSFSWSITSGCPVNNGRFRPWRPFLFQQPDVDPVVSLQDSMIFDPWIIRLDQPIRWQMVSTCKQSMFTGRNYTHYMSYYVSYKDSQQWWDDRKPALYHATWPWHPWHVVNGDAVTSWKSSGVEADDDKETSMFPVRILRVVGRMEFNHHYKVSAQFVDKRN